jgi:hypothetical protein
MCTFLQAAHKPSQKLADNPILAVRSASEARLQSQTIDTQWPYRDAIVRNSPSACLGQNGHSESPQDELRGILCSHHMMSGSSRFRCGLCCLS